MRTSSAELLIELDRSRPRGLRAQVEDELRDAIRSGRLTPGRLLPSTRALAADLGVTRGVIVDAYDQLLAEGYLTSRPGSGTVVNASGKSRAAVRRPRADDAQVLVDFKPGLPDPDLFPRSTWLRATRAALQTLPGDHFGYMDPLGLPQLRDAVAEYLGRVRGVSTDRDHVVVCNGFGHGLSMVVRALQESGRDAFAATSTATCAGRGASTASGATRSSPHSPAGYRRRYRAASPPASTCWSRCPAGSARPRSPRAPAPRGWSSIRCGRTARATRRTGRPPWCWGTA